MRGWIIFYTALDGADIDDELDALIELDDDNIQKNIDLDNDAIHWTIHVDPVSESRYRFNLNNGESEWIYSDDEE